MAQPFFGRRESDAAGIRSAHSATTGPIAGPAPGPAVPVALQSSTFAPAVSSGGPESAARLIVGPHIKLKGLEITDCDTLLVEGSVEATMKSRVIEIAEMGAFKGEAEIDMAEIRGRFDGKLTVRHKLVIHATGRVTGQVRYGKLVIEEGGQLCGEVQVATAAGSSSTALPLARVA
jgi:cytoskeletal protein CcmA (bactofilin family)